MYKIHFIQCYYQYVAIAFSIIIGVALQKHEEYNNLQH